MKRSKLAQVAVLMFAVSDSVTSGEGVRPEDLLYTEAVQSVESEYARWHRHATTVAGHRAVICVSQPEERCREQLDRCVSLGWSFFPVRTVSPSWTKVGGAGVYEVESTEAKDLKIIRRALDDAST